MRARSGVKTSQFSVCVLCLGRCVVSPFAVFADGSSSVSQYPPSRKPASEQTDSADKQTSTG
jgi:hypothetical protein